MRALGLTEDRARDMKKDAANGISGVVERALRDPSAEGVAKGVRSVAIAPSALWRKATPMVGPNCQRWHERESSGGSVEKAPQRATQDANISCRRFGSGGSWATKPCFGKSRIWRP